jgi:hypothetical protein
MHPLKYFAVLLLARYVSSHSPDRQSLIDLEADTQACHANCSNLYSRCCRKRNPCCCCKRVCTNLDCIQFLQPPYEPPETAFFNLTRLAPGAPCCGPKCSFDQCLELIRLQLLAIQDPLRIQRDSLEERPGEVECCGEGCSTRGCFSNLLTNLIQLQSPIQNTQNATKDTIAKEEM